MPLAIERSGSHNLPRIEPARERRSRPGTIRDRRARLRVGVVNNMPDSALAATERQFASLLAAASADIDVRLERLSLPGVPRSPEARAILERDYRAFTEARREGLDALIVTGAEPIAADLADEPYWGDLVALLAWADEHTLSTVLSCLAAHAGVRIFDGIARRALPVKCAGVFSFDVLRADELFVGAGGAVRTPHSRRNGLDRSDLDRRGYRVLTYDARIGVDVFAQQRESLFVFLQGHPEYEADSLAREYRRDMGRFLRGESDAPPAIPAGYYPPVVEQALEAFAARAREDRRPETLERFPAEAMPAPDEADWRPGAIRFYRNWLALVARRKIAADDGPKAVARWGG